MTKAKKVNNLYIGLIVLLYNSRGLIFISGVYAQLLSKHDSSQFLTLKKTFLILDNLDFNLSLFVESSMFRLGAES